MSTIPHDIVTKLSDLQSQIWQTVSLKVSEAINNMITFAAPLTVAARTADLYSELGAPMMVVQFAFAGLPENSQVFLVPQDTVLAIATALRGEDVEEVDDNLVADLRPIFEAVVQGICLAAGTIRSETIVATGLSIRFQLFSFPPNLQKAIETLRTQMAITLEDVNGTAIWLLDNEAAHFVLNVAPSEPEEEEQAFPRLEEGGSTAATRAAQASADTEGLSLLMDIPLEISVELGRVKMLVKDVVELGTGSIVEIDKAAGEPVDVMVNGRLVARGEVVVIEDNFGVRLTEILNAQERLNRLGEVA
ncbi:MAG TPA: flagellar motor switch protein FliN [Fimbriimonadaceae bacterium]|nr:flagellar motor switch protein FliN [Fimbriimonadaceae bacterium]